MGYNGLEDNDIQRVKDTVETLKNHLVEDGWDKRIDTVSKIKSYLVNPVISSLGYDITNLDEVEEDSPTELFLKHNNICKVYVKIYLNDKDEIECREKIAKRLYPKSVEVIILTNGNKYELLYRSKISGEIHGLIYKPFCVTNSNQFTNEHLNQLIDLHSKIIGNINVVEIVNTSALVNEVNKIMFSINNSIPEYIIKVILEHLKLSMDIDKAQEVLKKHFKKQFELSENNMVLCLSDEIDELLQNNKTLMDNKEELKKVTKELEASKRELNAIKSNIPPVKKELDNLKLETRDIAAKCDNARKELDRVVQDKISATLERDDVKHQIEDIIKEKEALEKELEDLSKRKETLSKTENSKNKYEIDGEYVIYDLAKVDNYLNSFWERKQICKIYFKELDKFVAINRKYELVSKLIEELLKSYKISIDVIKSKIKCLHIDDCGNVFAPKAVYDVLGHDVYIHDQTSGYINTCKRMLHASKIGSGRILLYTKNK